jgi:hypothetical protein
MSTSISQIYENRRISLPLPVSKNMQEIVECLFFCSSAKYTVKPGMSFLLPTSKNVPDSQDVSSPASSEDIFWISVCQRRPYFHVTKLDVVELDNWHRYLDFEEGQGDFERTAFLYERCLVACALYDKFWLRYARWMFSQGKEENTRIIYIKKGVDSVFMSLFLPVSKSTGNQ